ncbi:PilZ domain-containing protein [Propionivibrio limicola]|uniref:PilZ domain-containing protein n=1 Tax=Propionivibrio limicola TaxID=167645 RepID=UPI00129227C5|nr:PilZ domain-containing protein [Propionivibrio limicola]
MSNERRHYSRIAFHTPATLTVAGRSIDLLVADLSLKGALVELPAPIPLAVHEACVLNVHFNEVDDIVMECVVAHCEDGRVGLLCKTIDLDSATHLRRLVELNLGDPELLERELSALIAA